MSEPPFSWLPKQMLDSLNLRRSKLPPGVAIPTVEGIANDLKHIGAQRDGRTVQVSWLLKSTAFQNK
ncbi:hypothetical protein AB3S75_042936 [Citrus x aurantiifolia]